MPEWNAPLHMEIPGSRGEALRALPPSVHHLSKDGPGGISQYPLFSNTPAFEDKSPKRKSPHDYTHLYLYARWIYSTIACQCAM